MRSQSLNSNLTKDALYFTDLPCPTRGLPFGQRYTRCRVQDTKMMMKAELSGRYSLSPAMTVVALTAPGRNCRDIAEINTALNFNVTTVGGNSRNPGNGPSGTTPKYSERSSDIQLKRQKV